MRKEGRKETTGGSEEADTESGLVKNENEGKREERKRKKWQRETERDKARQRETGQAEE